MSYGVPYKGSKQRIAKDILNILPEGKRLVDLFGGGGAITHYALVNYSDKWSSFLYNDIEPLITDLFQDTINGHYDNYKPSWVSREEFNNYKKHDGYIKYIWSYGNNGKDYLYSKQLEEFKKNSHNYVVFGDEEALNYLEDYYHNSYYWLLKNIYNDNDSIRNNRLRFARVCDKLEAIRICVEYGDKQVYNYFQDYSFKDLSNINQKDFCKVIDYYCPLLPKRNKKLSKVYELKSFKKSLIRLQHLEAFNRLKGVREVNNLSISNIDYHNYIYQEGDIVYCDIPYKNTNNNYDNNFNHDEFYNWCKEQDYDIYISEYINNIVGEVVWCKDILSFNRSKRVETLQKI